MSRRIDPTTNPNSHNDRSLITPYESQPRNPEEMRLTRLMLEAIEIGDIPMAVYHGQNLAEMVNSNQHDANEGEIS